jgi:hypothetical protein
VGLTVITCVLFLSSASYMAKDYYIIGDIILRCVITVVCRINQTVRCMLISSDTTMYVLGGTLFTVCKAQLHVSAINVSHLQVVQ